MVVLGAHTGAAKVSVSDAAKELAAWGAYGQRLVDALPPIDYEAEALANRALAKLHAADVPRKLTRRP